jgi:hypothetical protein
MWLSHLGACTAETVNIKMEKVQRRATRVIPELSGLSYDERLKECGLTSLEERRVRGDLIETFKLVKGLESPS